MSVFAPARNPKFWQEYPEKESGAEEEGSEWEDDIKPCSLINSHS